MEITLDDLDGKYLVQSERDVEGEFVPNGDGETEIRNGLTYRKDRNGMVWESSFTILGPHEIQMESTVDPTHAENMKYIKDENGNPTNCIMVYKTTLSLRALAGRIIMKGVIDHAGEKTRLTLTKIGNI